MKMVRDTDGNDVSAAWDTWAATNPPVVIVDLFALTLVTLGYPRDVDNNGLSVYYANSEYDVPWQGKVYQGGYAYAGVPSHDPAPRISRGNLKTAIGVEVATMDLSIFLDGTEFLPPADGNPVTPRYGLGEALAAGLFEGAIVRSTRLYLSNHPAFPLTPASFAAVMKGGMVAFAGQITDTTVTRSKADLKVSSGMARAQIGLPRNVWQPQCRNTLYDLTCTLSRTGGFLGNSFYHNATIASVTSPTEFVVTPPPPQPSDYFRLGTIQFLDGQNAGLALPIADRSHGVLGDTFLTSRGVPRTPAIGTAVLFQAGCDKEEHTCKLKFDNFANFNAEPRVPPSDSTI